VPFAKLPVLGAHATTCIVRNVWDNTSAKYSAQYTGLNIRPYAVQLLRIFGCK
jgi:hypothetical protein